jgi:PAS domain-containing protein
VNEGSAARLAQIALLGEAAECVSDVAIFVWDEDRNYVAVNLAACELLGRTRDEILQMKVGDMSDDRAAPHFEEVQRGGALHTGSLRVPRADAQVDIDWVTCRTKIAGLPYMVSICWRKEPA